MVMDTINKLLIKDDAFVETVKIETVKNGLKSLASVLKFSNPKHFDVKANVLPYFESCSHLYESDFVSLMSWIKKNNTAMPTPSEFGDLIRGSEEKYINAAIIRLKHDFRRFCSGKGQTDLLISFSIVGDYNLNDLKAENNKFERISKDEFSYVLRKISPVVSNLRKMIDAPLAENKKEKYINEKEYIALPEEKTTKGNRYQDIEGNWHTAVEEKGTWYRDEYGVWLPKYVDAKNWSHWNPELITSVSEIDGVNPLLRRKGQEKKNKNVAKKLSL